MILLQRTICGLRASGCQPLPIILHCIKLFISVRVCHQRMMEVEVGHHSVLLTHCEGKFSAIGNQCTHYGAPLSKGKKGTHTAQILTFNHKTKACITLVGVLGVYLGAITGHTVRCPWHGACFNVHTGDLEEYPGIDSLPCHKVQEDFLLFFFAAMDKCCLFNLFSPPVG